MRYRRKFMMRRRDFLAAAGAVGATGLARGAEPPRYIDVHHHILPPEYVAAVGTQNIGGPAGRPTGPEWTPQISIDAMDRAGISTALTSISAPGIAPTDAKQARKLARACNNYALQLAQDHKGRFGTFAALPMPDVPGAVEEIRYAFDVLKTDGIGLLTSYEGIYLGDAHFDPVMAELNRRKALVFVHPTPCTCSAGVQIGLAPSAIEYPQDTTRTISNLLFSGTLGKYPDITFIFSHGGGTIPFIAGRILNRKAPGVPDVLTALKRLFYDTAQVVNPIAIRALLDLVGPERVVYGSDFPFVAEPAVKIATSTLPDLVAAFTKDEKQMRRIARENILTHLPRFSR